METAARFFDHAQRKLQQVLEHEMPNILSAAELVTESCKKGGKLYVFGAGHSHLIAEELYLRAGGLCLVHGILPPELMLHEMPNKSTFLERMEGYSQALVELHRVEARDSILVISNSGRNAVPVEMALEAKKAGAYVICVTSVAYSEGVTSRHSSGKRLFECADLVIDNYAPSGDAAVSFDGFPEKSGPLSTVTGAALLNAMVCGVIEMLLADGVVPPVFMSANLDGGDEHNRVILSEYSDNIYFMK